MTYEIAKSHLPASTIIVYRLLIQSDKEDVKNVFNTIILLIYKITKSGQLPFPKSQSYSFVIFLAIEDALYLRFMRLYPF